MYPCFPNEIIAHIVSFLDVETLGRVACASKELCALARPCLFSRILVSSEKDLGTLDSEIARHVRCARIIHHFFPPEKVLKPLLEHATQLCSIHISGADTVTWDQYSNVSLTFRKSLLAVLSNVEEVVLDGIACLPASVVRKLRKVKRLETAYFPCFDIDPADKIGFSSRPAPISFAISGWIAAMSNYSDPDDREALRSLDILDLSDLKRLYLSLPEPMNSPLIIKILSQCQQTLESLRLHFGGEIVENETTEAIVYLSQMKSLQEVYIAATPNCGPLFCFSAVVNAILSSLDTRLENMQLIVDAEDEADWIDTQMIMRGNNGGPREEWSVLDGKINELLIMQLKLQVVLRLPESWEHTYALVHQFVALAMPKSSMNGRFILEINNPSGIRSLFKLDDLKF
ncbi:hypothetical protein APHAL10511_005782 [Amanita phalloides]|nr:hypothetical protein APHAL10511_005782 [Amanita phalloides]